MVTNQELSGVESEVIIYRFSIEHNSHTQPNPLFFIWHKASTLYGRIVFM